MTGDIEQRTDLLRTLHVRGSPLVLANVWDAASARVVVAAGFSVVATSSGAVATALGFADHQQAPVGDMMAAAARITAAVDVPVTVDAEAGYGLRAGDLVDALIDVGAAGCNLEDTDHGSGALVDVDRQAQWLSAVRRAATDRGHGLVINARIDTFLAGGRTSQAARLADAISRARAYLAAGADCVFPIFLHEDTGIAAFVDAVDAPVNILALPQAPPTARLADLGVARVSYGSLIHRRSMEQLGAFLATLPRL